MKKILAATASVLAISAGSALAADLPSRKAAPPVYVAPAPVFSWTGLYVGAHAGGAIGDTTFGHTFAHEGGSFLGGLGIGYNFQVSPSIVVGIEADAGYRSEISGTSNAFGAVSETSEGYLGTARLRVGYSLDRLLVYATGGLAFGNVIAPKSFVGWGTAGTRIDNDDTLLAGWTAGGGVEYALNNNWSIKAEYLYARLEDHSPRYWTNGFAAPVGINAKSAVHVVRAGVNYHFNLFGAPAPVVAKY